MTDTTGRMIRTYKYRAFPPRESGDDFELAIALKRKLWRRLIEIEDEYRSRCDALMTSAEVDAAKASGDKAAVKAARAAHRERVKPDLDALHQWRVDRFREAKQAIAAEGLHWSDYNAVVFQFEGAAKGARGRGASVYNLEQSCGEALVNQIMGNLRPAQLGKSQSVLTFRPDKNAAKRKAGSHRSAYRAATLDMTLRGPRNPLGPARLKLGVVMHRPLPPDSIVKEVRAIRTWRTLINREGETRRRAEWHVTFVVDIKVAARSDASCAGLVFTWAGDGHDDGLQPFALLMDRARTRTLTMDYGYEADWDYLRELKERAEQSGDAADLARHDRWYRVLLRRRLLAHRTVAAELARKYACIAVPKINLAGKGTKRHTGPASLRMALRHALEARGGEMIEVGVTLDRINADPHRAAAKILMLAAIKHVAGRSLSHSEPDKAEPRQEVAA